MTLPSEDSRTQDLYPPPGQYGVTGPPPEPPRRKRWVRRALLGAGVLAVVIVGLGIALPASRTNLQPVQHASTVPVITHPTPTGSPPAGTAPSHVPTSAPAAAAPAPSSAAAPAPAAPHVVARFSGSGIENTPAFSTPGTWHLSWWYSCSSFGTSGNFIVNEYNTDGSPDFNGASVNELGTGGGPTATYAYGDAGQHYLSINSECDWQVVVVTG